MKIFISWSGDRSRAVAELMKEWIKCVIQATRPWISTHDIDRGARWLAEIGDQLQEISVGIACLTQENKNNPWILFEAGALAKGLPSSRVCTFLIDLQPADIEYPLAQFNHTLPDRENMWRLVQTLNSCVEDNRLDEQILNKIFETYWDQFDSEFKKIIRNHPAERPEPRSEKNLLTEILLNTRNLSQRIGNVESKLGLSSQGQRTGFLGLSTPLDHWVEQVVKLRDNNITNTTNPIPPRLVPKQVGKTNLKNCDTKPKG